MSTHDLNIANDTFPNLRADVNLALAALASIQAGTADPPTMYSYERQARTDQGIIRRRNAANSGWILEDSLAETWVSSRSSNTILGTADHRTTKRATGSYTQTFTVAATLGDGWEVDFIVDAGAGVTFDPDGTEQIDGATTLVVTGPASGTIRCTGSAFFTVGFTKPATQTQQEAGSSTAVAVTPAVQQYHPSAAKAWANFNNGTSILDSYNASSIDDGGSGLATLNLTVGFSSVNFAAVGMVNSSAVAFLQSNLNTWGSGSAIQVQTINDLGAATDPSRYNIIAFGDQ